MGEYASYRGERIKIGTCENLYYLRADQVQQLDNPSVVLSALEAFRFRFPFPGEDRILPGDFEDHDRHVRIDGITAPAELRDEHYSVQFTSNHPRGYVVSLPCPEAHGEDEGDSRMFTKLSNGVRVGRNGFPGATFLVQQKYVNGLLVAILECNCGLRWRVETLDDALDILSALKAMGDADHHRDTLASNHHGTPAPERPNFYDKLAERVRKGYDPVYVRSLGFPAYQEVA